jgi:hypothetical protein
LTGEACPQLIYGTKRIAYGAPGPDYFPQKTAHYHQLADRAEEEGIADLNGVNDCRSCVGAAIAQPTAIIKDADATIAILTVWGYLSSLPYR